MILNPNNQKTEAMKKAEVICRMKSHWSGLVRKHRSETAEAVRLYCSWSLSIAEVARELKRERSWVRDQLDLAAVNEARGYEGGDDRPPRVLDIRELVKSHDRGTPKELVEEFEFEGFTPDVAKRMAKTHAAAEAAIEKGVLQESHKQARTKTDAILFGPSHQWEMDLTRLCGQIRSAALTVDQAKISDLKKADSRKRIISVHAKWMEQIDRLRNFHPGFDDGGGTEAFR